jgi:signal transduction histidine kinase
VVNGILPAALTRGGLSTGIESLISDFPLPIELDATVPRLPPDTETTAYFIVAEALTNVIKHAHATTAAVKLAVNGNHLDIEVRDDGTGGADPELGSGLTGLLDRIEASNGTLTITSPAGAGTTVHATLPVLRSPRDR